MATLGGPVKLEAKIRHIRAPWWHLLWPIAWLAAKCGAREVQILAAIVPLCGVTVISCFGHRTFYVLRYRDGEFSLRKLFP